MDRDASLKWGLIGANYAAAAVFMIANGISFEFSAILPLAPAFGILIGMTLVYSGPRPNPAFAAIASTLLQIAFFTPSVILLSYAAASIGLPYIDDTLIEIDAALGFDWYTFMRWVNDRPLVGLVLHYAYQSPFAQSLIIVLLLPLLGHIAHMQRWLLTYMLCATFAVLASGPLAAVAAYTHLDVPRDAYANLTPAAAHVHMAFMDALRGGTLESVSLNRLEGIVTFPSFHAAMCLLYT